MTSTSHAGFRQRPARLRLMLIGLLLLGGAAAAAVISALLAPGARASGTCSIYFTGTTSSAWATASNWSLTDGGGSAGRTPNNSDYVCMSTAPAQSTVNLAASAAIAGINFPDTGTVHPTLNVTAGTFTVGSAAHGSFSGTVNNLKLSASVGLAGTADLTVTGTAASIGVGDSFTGAATLTYASGTSPTLNSVNVSANRHLTLSGATTITGPASSCWLQLGTGGVLENAATLTFTGPSGFVCDDGTASNRFKNDPGATLVTSLSTAAAVVNEQTPVDIQGTVTGTKGHLSLSAGGSLAGSWNLASGTSVDLSGGAYTASGLSVAGAGSLNLTNGTLSGTATVQTAGFTGGSVTAPATITVTNASIGAATFTGAGTVTLAAGGTSSWTGDATISNGFHLVNNGVMSVTGPASSCWLNVTTGGVLDNGGTLSFTGPTGFLCDDGTPANDVLNEAGATMTVNLSSGAQTLNDQVPFTNLGTLNVAVGTDAVSVLTTLNGSGVLSGGTYQVSGGTLQIPGSVVTNNATVIVNSGAIVIGSSSTNALVTLTTNNGMLSMTPSITLTGALTNTGTLTVAGGTFRASSYTQSSGLTTVASGAILKAGATGTAAVAINAGTLAGVGTVQGAVSGAGTVHPGGGAGALTISGSYTAAAAGTVQIDISGPSVPGTDFGQLSVSGSATVPGQLVLTTAPGYFPPVGTTYTIVTAGSRTGTFSTITGQDLSNGTYYDPSYTATAVVLTVTADPVVSVGSNSQPEGDSGTTTMSIPITLNAASDRAVSVNYTTVDGTANAGSDYVATSGTASIPAGSTSTSVSVTINGDTTFEPDETFSVQLSAPVNAVLGTASAASTISNDDAAPPSLTVTSLSPASMGQNATGRLVTISGSGFTASSTVSFSGTGLTVSAPTFVNATTLTVSIDGTTTTPLGSRDVTVSDPANGTATCVGCFTVTAKPAPTGVSPSTLQQGATNIEVSVGGSGYQPGTTIAITGTGAHFTLSTSYVSPTTLSMLTTVLRTTTVGAYTLRITNPDGGKATCTNCLSVTAGPTIASITPSSAARGTTVTVTVSGTNFVAGAHLIGPTGVSFDSVVVVNPTTITATMTVSSTAKAKANQKVTVVNPVAGGAGSASLLGLTIT